MKHVPAPGRPVIVAISLFALALFALAFGLWPAGQVIAYSPAAAQQQEDPGIEIGPDPDAPPPKPAPRPQTPTPPRVPSTPVPPAPPAPGDKTKSLEQTDLEREALRVQKEAERAQALAEEAIREAEAQAEAEMKRERVIRRRVDGGESGDDAGQIVRMGQNVVIESGETVEEVVVIGGDLTVRGEVAGDAVAIGGDLRVGEGGRVTGDAVSIGGELDIDEGGVVDGDQVEVANVGPLMIPGFGHVREDNGPGVLARVVKNVLKLLAVLFIGWLALVLLGHRLVAFADAVHSDFWRSLLVGVLVLVLWLPAVFLSAITVIGIPVAGLLILAVPLALLVGYLVGALAFGRRLAAGLHLDQEGALGHLLTGLLAIGLLLLLGQVLAIADLLGPVSWAFKFVGWTMLSFATILGTGALTTTLLTHAMARRNAARPMAPPSAPEPPPPSAPDPGSGEGPSNWASEAGNRFPARGKLVWETPPPGGEPGAGTADRA